MSDSSSMSKQSALLLIVVTAVVAFVLGRMSSQGAAPADDSKSAEVAAAKKDTKDSKAAAGKDAKPAAAKATIKRAAKGPEDALVVIHEVSDFQCPFCSRVNPTMKQIRETYPDTVRIEWVHQPLTFHNRALPAARASSAAGQQGKFWEMHDILFKNQRDLTDANFEKWAGQIGLDVAKWKEDYNSPEMEKYCKRDQDIANALGARGTPAFFINGKSLTGARPFDAFKTEIDAQITAVKAEVAKGADKVKARETVLARNNAKLVDYLVKGKVPPKTPAAKPKPKRQGPPPVDKTVWKVTAGQNQPTKGPEDALVTIVEFSDFQCPFCKRAVPTVDKIHEAYPEKVRVIFKQNPLPFHKKARPASWATLAAHEQGKFWEMHDLIFENMQSLDRDTFIAHATKIELNVNKFKKDFDAGAKKYDPVIAEHQAIASDVQAQGTPNFFVNGRKITGARPFEDFKKVIDEEITKAEAIVKGGVAKKDVYAKIIAKGKTFQPLDSAVQDIKVTDADGPATYGAKRKATITLVEYSDFQCPFCSRVGPDLKKVVDSYPGKARLIFKQFPLSFHKQAKPAAAASLAAGRQGKFWPMHDLIFENQRNLTDELYPKLAEQLGLKMDQFKKDFADPAIAAKIDADFKEGQRVGVRGTPTFFINGRKYQAPDRSAAGIKRVIEAEILKKKG